MAVQRMPQDILEGVNQRVSHLLLLTDPENSDPATSAYYLNVREALRTCVLLREYLADALKILFTEVIQNTITDYNLVGGLYVAGFAASTRICGVIGKRAKEARAKGVPEDLRSQFDEAMSDFEAACREIEILKRNFSDRWPWVDQGKLAKSIADERQGVRRYPAKEVFDELRRRVR